MILASRALPFGRAAYSPGGRAAGREGSGRHFFAGPNRAARRLLAGRKNYTGENTSLLRFDSLQWSHGGIKLLELKPGCKCEK